MKRPVDFGALLDDLKASGMTYREAAKRVGVTHTTIWLWKHRRCEPQYSAGETLVTLWATETGGDVLLLPRIRV
jgi:transposase